MKSELVGIVQKFIAVNKKRKKIKLELIYYTR